MENDKYCYICSFVHQCRNIIYYGLGKGIAGI